MTSEAKDVETYLISIPEDRLDALKRIRKLCITNLIGYRESMEYGMPSYSKNGVVEIAFASQKNNIALYLLKKEVLDQYRHHFTKSAIGKGCIRYSNPQKIDFILIEKMISDHYKSDTPIC
jgi:uncharacterized protein YdhG (YjbR/CyaY superfamily)